MCAVADLNSSDGASPASEQGVLANLPRTRPQRASARRAAARDGARAASGTRTSPARTNATRARNAAPSERRSARPHKPTAAKRPTPRPQQRAPEQGFECDGEATSGSVQPPGAVELLSSAAEVVSELAKAGVSRSERLLKDVFSRLPLP
jgi:hypothetical protein